MADIHACADGDEQAATLAGHRPPASEARGLR